MIVWFGAAKGFCLADETGLAEWKPRNLAGEVISARSWKLMPIAERMNGGEGVCKLDSVKTNQTGFKWCNYAGIISRLFPAQMLHGDGNLLGMTRILISFLNKFTAREHFAVHRVNAPRNCEPNMTWDNEEWCFSINWDRFHERV